MVPRAHPPLRSQHPLTVLRGPSHRASPHRPYGYPRCAPRRRPNAGPRPGTSDICGLAKRPVWTAVGRFGPPRKTGPPGTRPASPSRPEPKLHLVEHPPVTADTAITGKSPAPPAARRTTNTCRPTAPQPRRTTEILGQPRPSKAGRPDPSVIRRTTPREGITHRDHPLLSWANVDLTAVGISLLPSAVRASLEWGHALRCQWIRPFGVASLCLALGLLAGCTSSDGSTPAPDSPASVTTSITASPTVTSTSSPTTSSSASPSPTSLSSAPPTSSAPPWPADLTPDQVADAQAAIAAYTGYWRVLDQALAEPGKDWSTEIKRYATGTEADKFLGVLEAVGGSGTVRVRLDGHIAPRDQGRTGSYHDHRLRRQDRQWLLRQERAVNQGS